MQNPYGFVNSNLFQEFNICQRIISTIRALIFYVVIHIPVNSELTFLILPWWRDIWEFSGGNSFSFFTCFLVCLLWVPFLKTIRKRKCITFVLLVPFIIFVRILSVQLSRLHLLMVRISLKEGVGESSLESGATIGPKHNFDFVTSTKRRIWF